MKQKNLGIVVSDFHKEIAEEMLAAAKIAAQQNGFRVAEVKKVIGVFDIPLPLKKMLSKKSVDAAIVLGAVVQGETAHDEVVAFVAAEKISRLSLDYNKPVGFGISGPRMTIEQAGARAKEFSSRAVEAARRMLK